MLPAAGHSISDTTHHPNDVDGSRRFECPQCGQTFGRIEHLTRHEKIHAKDRYLKCDFCRKEFYRVDALRRHEQTHREPKRSLRVRGARACIACATGRRKCSGDKPSCTGCSKRSIECVYPNDMTTTQRARTGADEDQDERMDLDLPMAHSNPIENEPPESREKIDDDLGADASTVSELHVSSQELLSNPIVVRDILNSPNAVENTGMRFAPSAGSGHSQLAHSLLGNVQTQLLDNNPSPWYQSNFSSINWIPYDWIPDFAGDSGSLILDSNHAEQQRLDNQTHSLNRTFSAQSDSSSTRYHVQRTLSHSEYGDGRLSSPSSKSTHSAGHYYVDGDGARLPRVRKALYNVQDTTVRDDETGDENAAYFFPTSDESLVTSYDFTKIETLTAEIYESIVRTFELTCVSSTHYPAFATASFPSLHTLNHFLNLYLSNFQGVLPFIHVPTLSIPGSNWLFITALAATGAHYAEIKSSGIYSRPMHEFLRRAIETASESDGPGEPSFTQIKLLNCIGMMYSSDPNLIAKAKRFHHDLVSFCESAWNDAIGVHARPLPDSDWRSWCAAESTRRTGYAIWLLDCMWAFQFQMRPRLALEDAKVPVPCQEVLWEAANAQDWQQLYACSTANPSLHSMIQLAYIEKRMQSSTGEFSRILCVHALFRRTWEVEKYFSQPLTMWEPTAERQNIGTTETTSPIWLPNNPTFSKWRNSACDCLDILHWHANSVIGAASGMEHPTVLHLHLARVVLLTPFREIVQLTQLMTEEPGKRDEVMLANLIKHVQCWATEDQYKARLATIHAGVLFWHVRRYSVDAFYEPSSVFLATLALWAYGRFAAHTSNPIRAKDGETPQYEDDEDVDSLYPTSMQLDRPADDELVQLFVKRGTAMKANMMGVGNLCSPKGHLRVLTEGRKLLAGLKKWGYAKGLRRTLDALSETCQQETM